MLALVVAWAAEGHAQSGSRFRTVLNAGIHQRESPVAMAGLELEIGASTLIWPFIGVMLGTQRSGVVEGGLNVGVWNGEHSTWYVGASAAAYDLYSYGPAIRAGFERTIGSSHGLRLQMRWYAEEATPAVVVGVSLPGIRGGNQSQPKGKILR